MDRIGVAVRAPRGAEHWITETSRRCRSRRRRDSLLQWHQGPSTKTTLGSTSSKTPASFPMLAARARHGVIGAMVRGLARVAARCRGHVDEQRHVERLARPQFHPEVVGRAFKYGRSHPTRLLCSLIHGPVTTPLAPAVPCASPARTPECGPRRASASTAAGAGATVNVRGRSGQAHRLKRPW